MKTFDKKGVYHSYLRDASPLTVMFTKGVLPSKFVSKKENAPPPPPIAPFVVQGDDESYTYICENDACIETLKNTPTGVWVQVLATGMKEEARLEITLPDGMEPPDDTAGLQSASHAPIRPGVPMTYEAPKRPESVVEAYREALHAARDIRIAYEDEFGEELDEATRTIAVTLMIQSERSNWTMPIQVIAPPDPNDPAEVDMVNRITELMETRAVADQIAESINALVENGLTIGKAEKTIEYLEAQPALDQQGALPWDE